MVFCDYAVNNYWIDFFMLITDFSSSSGMAILWLEFFGAGWADMISPAYRATFNMMGIIFLPGRCPINWRKVTKWIV